MTIQATLLGLAFAAVCCISSLGSARSEDRQPAAQAALDFSVAVSWESGEPGSPRETITVSSTPAGRSLIEIQKTTSGATQKDSQTLSQNDVQRVWRIITDKKLREWLPQEKNGETYDFGEQRLRIEWRTRGVSKPQVHETAWAREIENSERLDVLLRELAGLARQRLQNVPSTYLH
jgi:hypothetical protein